MVFKSSLHRATQRSSTSTEVTLFLRIWIAKLIKSTPFNLSHISVVINRLLCEKYDEGWVKLNVNSFLVN